MDFTQDDKDILKETNKRSIKHDVKLTEVCKTLNKLNNKFDKLRDDIFKDSKTYINRSLFLRINGTIIGLLLLLGGYIWAVNDKIADVRLDVTKNTVCIEKLENK